MKKAYTIDFDYNHSGDPERDAFHLPFEHSDKASTIFSNPKYESRLPSRIRFQGNFNLLPEYDYPLTDLQIPVMSKRMVEVFRGLGGTNFKEIPVEIIDDTFFGEKFSSKGELLPQVPVIKDYRAIFIIEYSNAFDYENSSYQMSTINPAKPGYIETVVLTEKKGILPPLFRIKEASSHLFISEQAYLALNEINAKGIDYQEVEVL